MWVIKEHRNIKKICRKLPNTIVKKYELWKNIVYRHGPEKLRDFSGFHDEKLRGKCKGERSSRLSQRYRVVYSIERQIVTVFVLEITPHQY
ncbi:MAG: type II toxin-antitoxin system RelE/ParE family toxin [Candidatus Scalinduaceae bacterium]